MNYLIEYLELYEILNSKIEQGNLDLLAEGISLKYLNVILYLLLY